MAIRKSDYQALENATKHHCFQDPISQLFRDFLDAILDRTSNITPLELACDMEDVQAVEILLNNGADPNFVHSFCADPNTALDYAVSAGNLRLTKLLLNHGADSLQQPYRRIFYNYLFTHRNTWDVQETENLREMISVLTEYSLFHDAQYNDLIYVAAACANSDVTSHLLAENTCSIDWTDENGQTMLHIACYRGEKLAEKYTEYAQYLIFQGIDISQKDILGKTAYDYASERGRTSLIDLLLSHPEKTE